MPAEPKITVLMAVNNGIPQVRSAVSSILEQTYGNFEFLVVDDGSTDDTPGYLASIDDERFQAIRTDHGGLTKALNAGLARAHGDYIARQDADDLSEPTRLERQVAYLDENPDVAVVGSWYRVIDQSGDAKFDRRLPTGQGIIETLRLAQSPLAHGSAMIRRSALDEAGGYRNEFLYAQDLDLWLRIAEHHRIDNIPEFLYRWRLPDSGGSATRRYRQRLYAEMALQCARTRARGEPEPLRQAHAIQFESPPGFWRIGFQAMSAYRRAAALLGRDTSPPPFGE